MVTFTHPLFWLFFIYFIPVIFLTFYIPGNLLIHKQKLPAFQTTTLSFIIGIVLWALTGFIFGYLHIRWLSYIYLVVAAFFWLKRTPPASLLKRKFTLNSVDWLLAGVLLFGVIVQVITVWFIGYQTNAGFEFCCFWPDSFYHLALIDELSRTFPPIEPGLSGEFVRNYHFLANLVVADLIRVFHLPLIPTQYQYMPVFISLLLGFGLISIGQALQAGKQFTRWLVFFIFFSGDIIFLLTFLLGQGVNFTITVSENATTLWFSPPRMYAMVIVLGSMVLLLHYLKKKTYPRGILLGILIGSLVGFKIYLGFFALVGLGFITLTLLLRRQFSVLIPFITAGVVSLLLYLPINTQAGGLFFSGLWRIDDFAVRPELGLLQFTLAKQVYVAHRNYLRIFLIEGMYFLLYSVALFGMFALGFFQTKKSLTSFPPFFHLFLLSGLGICFIIGMFFLQNTGGANTLQFLFTIYIVGAFYAALSLSYWTGKMHGVLQRVVIFGIVILVGFRVGWETYANISDVRQHNGYFVIPGEEAEGLQAMREVVPDNATIAVESTIALEDHCYILSVFSQKNFFLCGNGILEDHGAKTEERVNTTKTIFTNKDANLVASTLLTSHIDYIYTPSTFVFGTTQVQDFLKPVYKNSAIVVYHVNKEAAQKFLP